MGARGFKTKYADKTDLSGSAIPQHRLSFDSNARAYIPTASELDLDGTHWSAANEATGDWSWKPYRYPADPGVVVRPGHIVDRRGSLEKQMPTFHGVPPSAAELYGRRSYRAV